MAHVLAVMSLKGGVAKTTSTVNLATAFALGADALHDRRKRSRLESSVLPWSGRGAQGKRVLVVDLDRQLTAGDYFRVKGTEGATLCAALAGREVELDAMVARANIELARGTIDVLPTTAVDYESANLALPRYPRSGLELLIAALEPFRDEYDYIFLDTRPELSSMSAAAMAACDAVVVPVTSEFATAIHVAEVFSFAEWTAAQLHRSSNVIGMLRTMWEKSYEADQVEAIIENLRIPVLEGTVPVSRQVSKAFIMGGTCVSLYPKARASKEYLIAAGAIAEALAKGEARG